MAGDGESEQTVPYIKGQRIDRYEIREHVGQGGMGAVYRAVDTKLGRTVALKTIIGHRRGDRLTEAIRERFMREALAASRIDHRNVVQVLDFGFAEDGTPYMAMEYLRGRSLSAVLKNATGPLALDYVADVVLSVCAALRACHQVGIIHRDLKPGNIFLCDTDTGWEVKVLDFGISKAPAADELTEDGQIIGTPQYLSPEQIEGTAGTESDQYALGVLMYVCLTQRLPYAGLHSTRLLRAISEGRFDPPRSLRRELPEALEAIVLRAMRVSPTERFESIHALGQRLWEFASARGQAQWKAFYFHAPAADETTATTDGRPVGSTASLERASELAKTEALRAARPELLAATKTAAAPGIADETSRSQSDIAGESALGDALVAERPGRARLPIVIAAVAVVGAIVWQRPWRAPAMRAATTAPAAPRSAPAVAAPVPPARAAEPLTTTPAAEPARPKHATRRHRAPNIDHHGIGIPTE